VRDELSDEPARYPGNRPLGSSQIARNGLAKGIQAPEFRLSGLDGTELSLIQFLGRFVLLVFSDPECVPCNALAPKLEDLHRRRHDLQVLMISRGDVESNREKATEKGLTFPIALQRHWEVSKEYGMFATPSGYLLDEKGIIAADVAIGSDAILELVDGSRQMRERMEARIVSLRREYDAGQLKIHESERQLTSLRETVMRIGGAILVLEELLSCSAPAGSVNQQELSGPNGKPRVSVPAA
jgi:peroxiredoxin